MSLKITERDKKLLYWLAIFVAVVLVTVYLIRPMLDRLADTRTQIEYVSDDLQLMQDKAALRDTQASARDAAAQEAKDAAAGFLPMMTSDEVDKLLTDRILLLRLDALRLRISPMETADSQTFDGAVENDVVDNVYVFATELRLGGSQSALQRIVDYWSQQDAIEISSLRWSQSRDEDTQILEIELLLYMADI